MDETIRIFLVRHGQSTANAGGPTEDPGALSLTELGWEQAHRFSSALEWAPTLLVASPFVRAQQTAEPLRQRFAQVPCETWPVQEYTYLDHLPILGFTEAERIPINHAFWKRCDPTYRDGDCTETFEELLDRIHNVQQRLLAAEPGSCILIVTHGFWMQGFRLALLFPEASPQQLMANLRRFNEQFWIANTELLEFAVIDERLCTVNQQHLNAFQLDGADNHA